ncbi:16534_t:CDS:2 [Acaulospora colombiana]|uniref:16534_t:CDS:1 n=1 Tax=Acaulospora colombiana TaxID=27376 RepID=A0ACA9MI99_9GLOM|nr:16534_t:CDS:2 [Acaulospora colombiana]
MRRNAYERTMHTHPAGPSTIRQVNTPSGDEVSSSSLTKARPDLQFVSVPVTPIGDVQALVTKHLDLSVGTDTSRLGSTTIHHDPSGILRVEVAAIGSHDGGAVSRPRGVSILRSTEDTTVIAKRERIANFMVPESRRLKAPAVREERGEQSSLHCLTLSSFRHGHGPSTRDGPGWMPSPV